MSWRFQALYARSESSKINDNTKARNEDTGKTQCNIAVNDCIKKCNIVNKKYWEPELGNDLVLVKQ